MNKTKKFNFNNREYTLRVYNNKDNDGILELNGRKFSGTVMGIRARIFSAAATPPDEDRPLIVIEMGYIPVIGPKVSELVKIGDKQLIDNLPKLMKLERGKSLEIGKNKLERI